MSSPLLTVAGLRVSYGSVQAVRGIDIEVGRGEVVALLGRNGAGKTSTLMALVGLVKAHAGHLSFDGCELGHVAPERRVRLGMALVPEGRRVFANLTVSENLRLGAAVARRGGQDRRETVQDMFGLFPVLKKRAGQPAGSLSGGQQQQLAIARALMSSPKLLLLDEPSLGLAPAVTDTVFNLLAQLRDRGVTMLLVEQNVSRALEIADRGYVLDTGTVAIAAPAAELLQGHGKLVGAYLGDERTQS